MITNYNVLTLTKSLFKEQVLTALTSQQKKIVAISALSFACIAAIWFLGKCYFNAKEKVVDPLDDAGRKTDDLINEKFKQNREAESESDEIESPKGKNSESLNESKPDEQLEHPGKEDRAATDLKPTEMDLEKVSAGEKENLSAKQGSEKREEILEDPSAKIIELAPTILDAGQEAEPAIDNEDVSGSEDEVADTIARDPMTRNIMIVGRSRSGKTTLRNVLENLCHIAPRSSLFYSTKEPELHRSELSGYRFNLLDTPGLCEYARINEKTRTNAEIIQLIKEKAQEHFGGKGFENVDTVIMTFTVQQGINSGDIDSLNAFLPELPLATKKILLITHAETYSQEQRASLRQQLGEHKVMAGLIRIYFEDTKNVLFSGSLEERDTDDESRVKRLLWNIHQDKERLIKKLLPEKEDKQLRAVRADQIKAQVRAFVDARFPKKGEAEKKETTTEFTQDPSKVEETAVVEPVQIQETNQQDSEETASSDDKIQKKDESKG